MANSIKKNLGFQTIYQILNTCLPLITGPYLARVLGATQLGVFSYTSSVVSYFTLIAILGTVNYGTRSIASVKDDVMLRSKKFCEIYSLQLGTSIIAIILYVIYVAGFDHENTIISVIQIIAIISCACDISWLFFGLESFKTTLTINLIFRIATVLAILVLVKSPKDLWIYALLMLGGTLLAQLFLWIYVPRYIRFLKISCKDIICHLKPNLLLFIPLLAMSVYHTMDKTMLGLLSTYEQTGYYYNSDKVINIPLCIINGVGTVMLPRMTSLYNLGRKEEGNKLFLISLEADCVDIDTGGLIFSTDMLEALYSLISTEENYDKYVNERTKLSLYADFLYPLAEESTLEAFYYEKPEGDFCEELTAARKHIWEVLRPYRMKLLRLAPAKFIHFGTTREILSLMSDGVNEYKDLGWGRVIGSSIKRNTAGYNSVLSSKATVGIGSYLEVSYVHGNSQIGNHCLLSYIDIQNQIIPNNVVLHGLKQKNGKFIARIFGINDNPKENKLFGKDLDEIKNKLDVELWENQTIHTLWSAKLYAEADSIQEAVEASLHLYAVVNDELQFDKSIWHSVSHKSLCSGFNEADPDAIIAWNQRMADLVTMDEIAKAIHNQVPASKLRKMHSLTKIQQEWLEKRLHKADFSEKMRLFYYLGIILDDEDQVQECFRTIQSEVLKATVKHLKYNETARIVSDHHRVTLPLRVNWGGGWSDTPPYCNENGGTVLNMAIQLNGESPVEVTLEKIEELKVVFDSRDMDVHGEFETIEPLQATGDPFDPFALQKACLLACGIIPQVGDKLSNILKRLGGGFIMHSEVTNVPKGSGLGTSSILSAACVKAVFEFMGIQYTENDLYSHVLAMEQIMSTGGGWQDQVGGITPGLKYITSMPGLEQKIQVAHVDIPEEARKELDDRFVLIYTGQRRLARNLLRDVVGRYVGNEPDSLFALEEIQKTAALMRFELERGSVDGFAKLLDYHWELSKKVDAGSSNTLIEQIFSSIEDLIAGKLVCGAGGGGFLQVILKKGVSKHDVEWRLKEVFMDSLVGVADCKLLWS